MNINEHSDNIWKNNCKSSWCDLILPFKRDASLPFSFAVKFKVWKEKVVNMLSYIEKLIWCIVDQTRNPLIQRFVAIAQVVQKRDICKKFNIFVFISFREFPLPRDYLCQSKHVCVMNLFSLCSYYLLLKEALVLPPVGKIYFLSPKYTSTFCQV